VKVFIANFSAPHDRSLDYDALWREHQRPPARARRNRLFEQPVDWGFHIYALGAHLMDQGVADHVEFWDYGAERKAFYLSNGILKINFHNPQDIDAYVGRFGYPDLFINHGSQGVAILERFEGKCFRVFVPAMREGAFPHPNRGAECYMVDSEEDLDERSILYVPVVNIKKIFPDDHAEERDFIYLASNYGGKRHDLLLDAVRGSELTGHLHPVNASTLDLAGTRVTTSGLNERDVVDLLRGSRIAVYPGDQTSNPAAMWECVAAGLPIVVNAAIAGGKHLVVPGVTGELAGESELLATMQRVLRDVARYRPREHFVTHWDTLTMIERQLEFFRRMGWAQP
jgi:hypothetical protein